MPLVAALWQWISLFHHGSDVMNHSRYTQFSTQYRIMVETSHIQSSLFISTLVITGTFYPSPYMLWNHCIISMGIVLPILCRSILCHIISLLEIVDCPPGVVYLHLMMLPCNILTFKISAWYQTWPGPLYGNHKDVIDLIDWIMFWCDVRPDSPARPKDAKTDHLSPSHIQCNIISYRYVRNVYSSCACYH